MPPDSVCALHGGVVFDASLARAWGVFWRSTSSRGHGIVYTTKLSSVAPHDMCEGCRRRIFALLTGVERRHARGSTTHSENSPALKISKYHLNDCQSGLRKVAGDRGRRGDETTIVQQC